MKWLRKNWSTVGSVLIFFTGISLMLYPVVSDYWNSFHQTKAIAGYTEMIGQLNDEEYREIWK